MNKCDKRELKTDDICSVLFNKHQKLLLDYCDGVHLSGN